MIRELLVAALVASTPPDPLGFAAAIEPEAPHLAYEELDRFLFLNPTAPEASEARARLVRLCVKLGRFTEAERHVDRLEAASPTPLVWQLRRAEVRSLSGDAGHAVEGLWPLTRQPASAVPAWKRVLWIALRSHWWGQALEAGREIGRLAPAERARLGPLLADLERHAGSPALSVDQARLMSTFLPGSGQIYAGAWRDGLTSLAVNGGFATLLVGAVRAQDWVGTALVVGWGGRYYMGGIDNAGARVNEHNARIDQALAAHWLGIHEAWLLRE